MRETWVWSLGWEHTLEKEMAPHSSTLAWRIPWTEEPGRLQSTVSQRVGHDWATSLSLMEPIKLLGKVNPAPCFSKAVLKRSYIVIINYQANFSENKLVLLRLFLIKNGDDSIEKIYVCTLLLDSNPVNFVFETLYVPVNWTESWILISSDVWILQTNGSDFFPTLLIWNL